jgi:predicted MFS family arabinose efflux permease
VFAGFTGTIEVVPQALRASAAGSINSGFAVAAV